MTGRSEPESGDGPEDVGGTGEFGEATEPEAAGVESPDAGSSSSGSNGGPPPEGSAIEDLLAGADDTMAAAEPATPEGPEGTILTDVQALAAERDEYLVAVQRLQADFENYRKRVARQQEEQSARAAAALVGKLLPVLDALDLAAAHVEKTEGGSESVEGQALVQARALLDDTLAKEGLERVAEAGVPFDPVVHDAVAHAPAEEPEDGAGAGEVGDGGPGEVTVDEVFRAGYRWRGQVLRPAMVKVRG
jgi:molecular chaperone GrpE